MNSQENKPQDRFRFRLGAFECLVINDGSVSGTAEMMFTNAPADELTQALGDRALDADHLPSTWSCLLVKSAEHLVLIDTGLGSGQQVGGNLLPSLAEAGITPADIDTVILTHGHPDHMGGGVTESGEIAFPNATYLMGEAEWQYWTSEETLAQRSDWTAAFTRQKLGPLTAVLQIVEDGQTIVPGIRVIAAPGHTVGQMAVTITSEGKQLLVLADVALHPIHIAHPDWVSKMDRDPQQTVATRRKLYQWASENDVLVLAYHFPPFPSMGHIVRNDDGWDWQAHTP